MKPLLALSLLAAGLAAAACRHTEPSAGFIPLFPKDGVPEGWVVRAWNDLAQPAEGRPVWQVDRGVLQGGEPRGSWLVSEREYGNFQLEFEFKLGETGNSGCALRAPMHGDPAFDGIEVQMADFRYNPEAKAAELTGGLYRALAPQAQVYRPTEWNRYEITLQGSRIRVVLNGELIQDADLNQFTSTVPRHDGTPAPPLRDRPRRGHLGFQELSRDGSHAQIRAVRLRELPD